MSPKISDPTSYLEKLQAKAKLAAHLKGLPISPEQYNDIYTACRSYWGNEAWPQVAVDNLIELCKRLQRTLEGK